MKLFTISSAILVMLVSGAHAADEFGSMFTREAPAALTEEVAQDPMDIFAAELQDIAPAAGDEVLTEAAAQNVVNPMNVVDQPADNSLNGNGE